MKTNFLLILVAAISLQFVPLSSFHSLIQSYPIYSASNSDDEFDDEEGSEEEQENEEIEENA
jgi:hypothetical protein